MSRNLILHPEFSGRSGNGIRLDRWLVPRHSAAEEQYRVLATRLRHLAGDPGSPGRVLGVTSAVAAEGKTTASLNLAVTLARDFQYRVLFLEADLKRPSISRGNRHIPGLVEFVSGEVPLEDCVCPSGIEGLSVFVAGRAEGAQSVHVLGSPLLHRSLVRLRERYDFVIVDCPPLMSASDMGLISEWSDHFLLVVRAGTTDRSLVLSAVEGIGKERFVGVVLGDASEFTGRYSYTPD